MPTRKRKRVAKRRKKGGGYTKPSYGRRPYTKNLRIGGYLGLELKFYDTSLVAGALLSTGALTGGEHDPSATIMLNTVVQGDNESQRIGRKITMKNIMVRGVVSVPIQAGQNAADAPSRIFIALVLDKQTNGAQLNSEDVFTNKSANAILTTSNFNNLEFKSRFRVLGSRKFTMQNPAIANATSFSADNGIISAGLEQSFELYKDLKSMTTLYNGTTEDVANIIDNSLHIVAFTTNTVLAPTISYNARLRFLG